DQAEKKGPQQNGLIFQQPAQPFGQGEDADQYAQDQGGQKISVDTLPYRLEPFLSKEGDKGGVDVVDRGYKFLIDAGDKGDGPPGHPGNDIGGTHGHPLEDNEDVPTQITCFHSVVGHGRVRIWSRSL